MIEYLDVFEIDPVLQIITNESGIFRDLDNEVNHFFRNHIISSMENKRAKTVRFRDENSPIVRECRNCFSEDSFEVASRNIAHNLAMNIHSNVNETFHFILAVYEIDNDNNVYDEGERILSILKMKTNTGVQMTNGQFFIQEDMLPDLGNQLQKCSFVVESFLENYGENNTGNRFHSKILDKQDVSISNYFMNLMASAVVANDEDMSKLSETFINRVVRDFVSEDQIDEFDREMDIIYSRRQRVSVHGIIEQLEPFIQDNLLEAAGYTIDGLGDHVFEGMQARNPSVQAEFSTIPDASNKFKLGNVNRSVIVRIEKGLINTVVTLVEPTVEDPNYTITIPAGFVQQ